MSSYFLNIQPALFKRKINIKFLLASLKIQSNSKNCSESRIKFCSIFPLISLVDFSSVFSWPAFGTIFTFTGGFWNNFQSHRCLLGSQNKLPEEGYWKNFLQLVSDFLKGSRIFFAKIKSKIVKTFIVYSESTVLIFRILKKKQKNAAFRDIIPLK